MGIFDKARDALQDHADKLDPLADRPTPEADRRTGGTHGADLDRGAGPAKDKLIDRARRDAPPEPGRPA